MRNTGIQMRMNRLLILLLLIPMVSFGEEIYTCDNVYQININKNELILKHMNDDYWQNQPPEKYKKVFEDDERVGGFLKNDTTLLTIVINKKLNRLTLTANNGLVYRTTVGHHSMHADCAKISK